MLARDLIVNGLLSSVEGALKKAKDLLLVMVPLEEDAKPREKQERETLLTRKGEIFDKIVTSFIFLKSPTDTLTAKLKSQLADNKDKWFRGIFNMLTGSQSNFWHQPGYLAKIMWNNKMYSPFRSGVTVEELRDTRLPMPDARVSLGPD